MTKHIHVFNKPNTERCSICGLSFYEWYKTPKDTSNWYIADGIRFPKAVSRWRQRLGARLVRWSRKVDPYAS
jgi:predicted DNA-binding transcriptional regulator AlpA